MYALIKRLFDIFVGGLLFIVVILTFPIVAIGIKLSSPGPILYVSTRIGKNGKAFKFYKYRSMHIENGKKSGIVEEQKRVFTFGKILRRTKMDELPQALNVLKGDISVVGPRPMLPTNVLKVYGGRYEEVQKVRPGLTSYASLFDYTHGEACISDREVYNSKILPIKQEMELYYVRNASVVMDLHIICKTIIIIVGVVCGKKEFAYPKEYHIAKENLKRN